jgi:hypothetical protein
VKPSASAPSHLRSGLNDDLNRLLDEPHYDQ